MIADRGDRLRPIEIKAGATFADDWLDPMEKWLALAGKDAAEPTLIHGGETDWKVTTPSLALNVGRAPAQAAHMAYTVDGHRVTLMIFPVEHLQIRGGTVVRSGGRDVLLGRHNGYNVAVAVDGDMAYAVSSDLPKERLISLLNDMSI